MMFPILMQPPPRPQIERGTIDHDTDVFGEQVPEAATSLEHADTVIAKQMMALSVEDREKIYMDVHGVKVNNAESQHDIEAGLSALENELQRLEDKHAYDLAWSMDPKYVENRDFRLAFLRADLYDPAKAALRIVRHFQVKMELFGLDKLAMDIVQDDLCQESMKGLYYGRGQTLNAKDRAGRTIVFKRGGSKFSLKANLQRNFYDGINAGRNPDIQVNGLVTVVYAVGVTDESNMLTQAWGISKLGNALPCRFEALHLCHDSFLTQALVAVVKTASAPFIKIRTRTHYCTHKETLESLASFGIDPNDIPISEEGEITNLESYHQSLRKQRARERLTQPRRNRIYVPSDEDVLIGKGTPFQNHPGNEKLRTVIVDRLKDYEKASKQEKVRIAKDILNTVHQNAGLFLRKDGDAWVCAANDIAHQKISTTFRTYRRYAKMAKS